MPGDGLVAAAHQRNRVTAELGWVDACHPESSIGESRVVGQPVTRNVTVTSTAS
jgi:hypothetical protein